jgi:hypothetical protein
MFTVMVIIFGSGLLYLACRQVKTLHSVFEMNAKLRKEKNAYEQIIAQLKEENGHLEYEIEQRVEECHKLIAMESLLVDIHEIEFKKQLQRQEQEYLKHYVALEQQKDDYIAEIQEVRQRESIYQLWLIEIGVASFQGRKIEAKIMSGYA